MESAEQEEVKIENQCELIWAQVKIPGASQFFVGSFYRPPDEGNPEYLENLCTFLSEYQLEPILGLVAIWTWVVSTGTQTV